MPKILIIDDDEKVLKLYSDILVKEGYAVLTACDGLKGLDSAVSGKPDLILLDVMMPSLDGVQVFEQLSQDTRTGNIPVVFLTSLVKDEEVRQTRGEIGGHEYISKSTPRERFLARVKEILLPQN